MEQSIAIFRNVAPCLCWLGEQRPSISTHRWHARQGTVEPGKAKTRRRGIPNA